MAAEVVGHSEHIKTTSPSLSVYLHLQLAGWLATQHKREQASERTTRGLLAFSNGAKPIKEGRKEASEVENESYKNILALPSTISNGFPKKKKKKTAHSTRSLL